MITPSWYPTRKQLRQFAMAALPGFGLIGLFVWRMGGSVQTAYTVAAIGPVVSVAGLVWPESIRWLYLLLCGLAFPIGWVVSAVLLRAIFYGLFTPVGFVFRLMGRDPLRMKKPAGSTYWLEHPERGEIASYFRQA